MSTVIKRLNGLFTDREKRFLALERRGFYDKLSDEQFIRKKWKAVFGTEIDLDNPKTFNEKLQWLKLHDRKPEYTTMVDKYLVKDYVAKLIGEEYIIPTLGVWDSYDEINFDSLPDKFVLKCTHDSASVKVIKDKNKIDHTQLNNYFKSKLRCNYYYVAREWPYKDVKPRIMVEKYMEDFVTQDLRDYKFFCFNGEPKLLFIACERQNDSETKFDFYDIDFTHLPFRNGHPNADVPPQKPYAFEKMKELAKKLSIGIPQVRIDFYEVNGHVLFGEYTFCHWGGFVPFEPEEWDEIIGNMLLLPE